MGQLKRVMLVGGGTGGHVTPLRPVTEQIKKQSATSEVFFIGQRGDRFADLMLQHKLLDRGFLIYAGKYRRYPGDSTVRRLFDIRTNLLNVRDVFLILLGCIQSYRVLRKVRPSVVLLKGGFVGVPVAVAARLLQIPIVTHDSDALAGLANRIASRWSVLQLVSDAVELYPYPEQTTVQVGLPVAARIEEASRGASARKRLADQGIEAFQAEALRGKGKKRVLRLLVSGGSQGAERINEAMMQLLNSLKASKALREELGPLELKLIVGEAHKDTILARIPDFTARDGVRVSVEGFVDNLPELMAAADLMITRSSASTVMEAAALKTPLLLIPSKHLLDQIKNASLHEKRSRARVLYENEQLADKVIEEVRSIAADDGAKESHRRAQRMYQELFIENSAVLIVKHLFSVSTGKGAHGS